MSAIVPSPVRAIVRVRLAPWLRWQAFEQWLRAIPAVMRTALVSGEAGYELLVDCTSFTDLGDVLTCVCGCRGVEVESTELVQCEQPSPASGPERVTLQRPRMM